MKLKTKYLLLVFLLFIVSSIFLLFNNTFNKQEVKFEIKDRIMDIGKSRISDESKAAFKIKNTGTNIITISNVEADCHCTVPDWTTKTIKPNQTYTLDVTYDNHTLGYFEQTISVYFKNSKEVPLLIMRGKIIDDK